MPETPLDAPSPNPLDYERPTSGPKRRISLTEVLVLVAIVALLISIFLPTMFPRREDRRCYSNLRQIGQALHLYAAENGGHLPDTLEGILDQDVTTAVLVCPSSDDTPATPGPTTKATIANASSGGHVSYLYFGKGFTDSASAEVLIACDRLTNHPKEGINALFGDGHCEFFPMAVAQKMLAEVTSGHNPPRMPRSTPSTPSTSPSSSRAK